MCFAGWINKADKTDRQTDRNTHTHTHTHTEYVVLNAFHSNSSYKNVSLYYVLRKLPILLQFNP